MKNKTNVIFAFLFLVSFQSISQLPSNDECNGALTVPVNTGDGCVMLFNANTGSATQSTLPCIGFASNDVWFKFTAIATTHRIQLTPVSYCNLVMEFYSGSCGNLGPGNCIYPTGLNEQVIGLFNNLTIGATYYFRVYDRYGNGPNLNFTICINTATAYITNDNCAGAINIVAPDPGTTNNNSNKFSNVGATESMPACNGTAEDDIWFTFTATNTRHQIWTLTTQPINPVVEVFSNSCGNLVSMGCYYLGNGGGSDQTIADITSFVVGNIYYYRVYGQAATNNRCDISTFIRTPPSGPSNDECSGALTVPVNNGIDCGVLFSANTGSATQSILPCIGIAAKDVWYKFTATATTHRIQLIPVSYCNLVMEFYSGSCGNLGPGNCIYPTGLNEQVIGLFNNLTIGATYYFRVYDRYGNGPNLNFTICINTATAYITNDNCAGAASIVPEAGINGCNFNKFSNTGATESMPACNGTAEDDIWFAFTATSTRHQIWIFASQPIKPVIEVFSGNCDNLVSMGCYYLNHGGSDQTIADITSFIPGNTYFYRVYGQSAANNRCDISTCIKTLAQLTLCSLGTIVLSAEVTGTTYQWEVNTGSGFNAITDNATYTGTTAKYLHINNAPTVMYGYQYRCLVNSAYTTTQTIRFTNYWTGSVDATWENPLNWSCGVLPDGNTDVIINSAQVFINSNSSCRSVNVGSGAYITVNSGFKLTITR